jgi:hypothetical protein
LGIYFKGGACVLRGSRSRSHLSMRETSILPLMLRGCRKWPPKRPHPPRIRSAPSPEGKGLVGRYRLFSEFFVGIEGCRSTSRFSSGEAAQRADADVEGNVPYSCLVSQGFRIYFVVGSSTTPALLAFQSRGVTPVTRKNSRLKLDLVLKPESSIAAVTDIPPSSFRQASSMRWRLM